MFPDDNGNRLNLCRNREVYTDSLYKNTAQITISDNNVSAVFQTPRDENGECEAYVALLYQMGALVKVEHKSVLADDAGKG